MSPLPSADFGTSPTSFSAFLTPSHPTNGWFWGLGPVVQVPSRNQMDKVPQNADGSVDLYFSPTKAEGVNEKNWIQTLEGRAYLVTIRLYGSASSSATRPYRRCEVSCVVPTTI